MEKNMVYMKHVRSSCNRLLVKTVGYKSLGAKVRRHVRKPNATPKAKFYSKIQMLLQKPNSTPKSKCYSKNQILLQKPNATPKAKCYSKSQILLQKPNATPKTKFYSKSYSESQMPFHKSLICFWNLSCNFAKKRTQNSWFIIWCYGTYSNMTDLLTSKKQHRGLKFDLNNVTSFGLGNAKL